MSTPSSSARRPIRIAASSLRRRARESRSSAEKPIAFDLGEIDEALEAVDEAGVQLQIGFNRRFDANHARVKQAIERGEIGDPHTMTIISRDPSPPPIDYIKVSGGLMMDMMIHDFDLVALSAGARWKRSTPWAM